MLTLRVTRKTFPSYKDHTIMITSLLLLVHENLVGHLSVQTLLDILSHMSGRKIWINFEAYQRSILRINPWKKFIYLRPFSKYLAEPFLRSKAVRGWILRIWLRKKMLSKKYCCQPRKCKTTLCKLNLYKDMNYFLSPSLQL